jgi:uncharacterized protein (TIGR01777 family)
MNASFNPKGILITGSSGMIAGEVVRRVLTDFPDSNLILLSTKPDKTATYFSDVMSSCSERILITSNIEILPKTEYGTAMLHSIDTVINLAGYPVSRGIFINRSTVRMVRESRITYTGNLISRLAASGIKPELFINASATAIYGSRDSVLTEKDEIKTDTGELAGIVKEWENEASRAGTLLSSGVTLLRFGNVISVKGGLLKNTLFLTGRGIIPVFGDGNQIIPWISLKDVGRAVSFIISQKITGAVNMCQPRRTTATELFEKISIKLCNRKPILQLHIPARIIRLTQRHAAVALLDSVPAFPEELSRNGFVFSNELTL